MQYRFRLVASAVWVLASFGSSGCWRMYSVDRRPRKIQIAAITLKELEGALQLFNYDTGRFPTTAEGLDVLVHAPENIEGWRGPYLGHEIPIDPWGRAYVYRYPGQFGQFDLFPLGRDGLVDGEGEDADIVSWR